MNNILMQMTPAMKEYLIGLIYRNTRTSCVCLASLIGLAHDQLYRLLYSDFPYSWAAMGIVCQIFGWKWRLFDSG